MTQLLLSGLAEVSGRATIAAALVAAVLVVLRVRDASTRHRAWTAVLLAMLVMPVLASLPSFVSLSVPTTVLPVEKAAAIAATAVEAITIRSRSAVDSASTPTATGSSAEPLAATGSATQTPSIGNQNTASRDWSTVLVAIYGIGVLVMVGRMVFGYVALRRVLRASVPVDVPPDHLGIVGGTLRESTALAAPAAVGAFSPLVVLPADWQAWPVEKLRAVLAHERAHIERRDLLVALLARVNRCVFWFHPLAWWLNRQLAALAEHASDDVAVRVTGEPDRYAQVLLEMARSVRSRGARLSWQGLGIGGNGVLGRRIDRLMQARVRKISSFQKAMTALGCVAAVVLAIACRPQSIGLTLTALDDRMEQRDRALLAELTRERDQRIRQVGYGNLASGVVTLPERRRLEAAVQTNPDDLVALQALLDFHWTNGTAGTVPERRRLILSVIERHPESDLAGSIKATIFPRDLYDGPVSQLPPGDRARMVAFPGDPIGYAQAKRLWLSHADRPGVTARVLGNAARFFEASDHATAEWLLIRAGALDPNGRWTERLGQLYAAVLGGSQAWGRWRTLSLIENTGASAGYASVVREKLGRSKDEILLVATGWFLTHMPISGGRDPWQPNPKDWAVACFERAVQLNPNAVLAHTNLLGLRPPRSASNLLKRETLTNYYESVAELPESQRFRILPGAARSSYQSFEQYARRTDPNFHEHVELARKNARRFAEEAIALSAKYKDDPAYGTAIYSANMTLSSLALSDGDKASAIAFMRKAIAAPVSEELAYSGDLVLSMFAWHLPGELLKQGERQAAIEYLDRMATINLARRTEIREVLAAVRRGENPKL